ncbi:LysR family transcriptional regulator [Xylophilus sp. Kf1]|nr:LysR family transcriptional regulator [Xylophilus sp. Kf1]
MNLTLLNTLRTILDHGSFTAAAGVVGCSPSAVSLQVKQLEAFFGRPLFDRSTRTMVPTPFAREVVGAVGDFAHALQRLRSLPAMAVTGRIQVGVITSMQSDVLPGALRELRRRHPQLELVIPPLNDSDELLAELKAGRIDVALVARPRTGALRGLIWREMHRQPYVLLVPADATGDDPAALLERYDWVGYDLSLPGGKVAARFVRSLREQARCTLELRSVDAIVSLVAEGLGVSVIPQPRRALVDAYPVREVALGARVPFRALSLAWRAADESKRNVQAVAEAFALAFERRRA